MARLSKTEAASQLAVLAAVSGGAGKKTPPGILLYGTYCSKLKLQKSLCALFSFNLSRTFSKLKIINMIGIT